MEGLPYDLKVASEIVSQELQDRTELTREQLDMISPGRLRKKLGLPPMKVVDGEIPPSPLMEPKYHSYEEINFGEVFEDM